MNSNRSALHLGVSAIRRRPFTLWLAAVWPYLLLAIVYLTVAFAIHASPASNDGVDLMTREKSLGLGVRFALLLAFVVSFALPSDLATAGVTFLIWTESREQVTRLGDFFKRLGKVAGRFLVLSILIGFIGLIATCFLVIPGFVVFALGSMVIPVLIVEQPSAGGALRKGLQVAWKKFGEVILWYGLSAIALAVVLIASVFAASSLEGRPWWAVISVFWTSFVILASLITLFRSAVVAFLYLQVVQN